jgi:hypothetical protein
MNEKLNPSEAPTATPADAQSKIGGTVEVVIRTAILKAQKLEVGGIDKVIEPILLGRPLADEEKALLSSNGKRLVRSFESLRSRTEILTAGLRQDAAANQYAELIRWLSTFQEAWETTLENPVVVKGVSELVDVVERTGVGIQGRLMTGDYPLVTPETKEELTSLNSQSGQA